MTAAVDDREAGVRGASRPRDLIYAFVMPLAIGLLMAAITQNFRLGRGAEQPSRKIPEEFIETLPILATVLLIGAWWLSRFRLRTPVAAAGLAVLWSAYLLVEGPSPWLVASLLLLLLITLSLLIPGRPARPRAAGG